MSPYILQERREVLDPIIRRIVQNIDILKRDGELNYVFSRLIASLYGRTYAEMNSALGLLDAVGKEYYREVVAIYEDEKKAGTGGVY